MNRLWKTTLAVGLFAAVALGDSLRFGRSSWPSVALFCIAGVLACIAAAIDAAEQSAKHEAELDEGGDLETIRVAQVHVAGAVTALQARVEHLEKKDALNALG